MPVGSERASIGPWRAYIKKYPHLASNLSVIKPTEETWELIDSVNRTVNVGRWVPERKDDWEHIVPGDCENFSLLKRKLLYEEGVDLGGLRICVGRTRRRGKRIDHAVLHVVTDRGDFALDNFTDEILPWQESRLEPAYRTASGFNIQVFSPHS